MDEPAKSLSAGETQRMAVARAVAAKPDLLLADEPLSGLEDEAGNRMMRLLLNIRQFGTTVLIATRDRDAAAGAGARELRFAGRMYRRNGACCVGRSRQPCLPPGPFSAPPQHGFILAGGRVLWVYGRGCVGRFIRRSGHRRTADRANHARQQCIAYGRSLGSGRRSEDHAGHRIDLCPQ